MRWKEANIFVMFECFYAFDPFSPVCSLDTFFFWVSNSKISTDLLIEKVEFIYPEFKGIT